MMIPLSPLHSSSLPYLVYPPMITRHPQNNINIIPGTSVTFTVTAAGSNIYTWKQNGNLLPSCDRFVTANETLTIQNVQPSDAGSYCCVVSNDVGSTTSNSATLALSEFIRTFGAVWFPCIRCWKQQMGQPWSDYRGTSCVLSLIL